MALRPANIASLEIGRIDRNAPIHRTDDGRPVYRVRCRVPFSFDAPAPVLKAAVGTVAAPELAQLAEGSEGPAVPAQRAEGSPVLIEGIASSTSVDWYGTRMTPQALESMRAQFVRGVDYFPRHHGWLSSVEWDEVMGRTVDARVERATVKNPHEASEAQSVLYCTTMLDMSEERAQKLLRRIEAGRAPGQSIGGWFTEIQVTYSDDDEYEAQDIAILEVQLDHLAAVRSPANPDADKVYKALAAGLSECVQRNATADGLGVEELADRFVITVPGEASDEEATRTGEPAEARSAAAPAPVDVSSSEAIPPRPEAATQARETPEESMPMTPEEIAALGAGIATAVEAGVARAFQAQAEAQRAAAPPAPAAPAVAPVNPLQAELDAANARARAAEARAQAAETMAAVQPAQRAAVQPTEPPKVAERELPAVRGPGGVDLRSIAPKAVRAAARAGEAVTPGLVMRQDGPKAVAQLAKAEGYSALAELALGDELLISDRKGAVRALAARYGARSKVTDADVEDRDTGGIGDLLHDVIRAAVDDGLITPASQYSSWT